MRKKINTGMYKALVYWDLEKWSIVSAHDSVIVTKSS